MNSLASVQTLQFAQERLHLQAGLGQSPAEVADESQPVKLCAAACLVHAELMIKQGAPAAQKFEQSVVGGGPEYLLHQINACGFDLDTYRQIIKENDAREPAARRAWFSELLGNQMRDTGVDPGFSRITSNSAVA